MAYKFEKNIYYIDTNKNSEILSKAEDMDTQDILQYSLINNYPFVFVVDMSGNNLIHLTIINPKKIKSEFNKLTFIKFLIQNNVDPDQPNKNNQTPLHLACQYQYSTIVEYLLELKVNVNYKDNNGFTPLHYLYTGHIKLYVEREIKEFIVPNKNENNIDKKKLDDLKIEIYNNIFKEKKIPLIESIDKTFAYYLDLNTDLNSGYLSNRETDKNFINKIYEDIINSMNRFLLIPDEDIVLHEFESNSYKYDDDNTIGIIRNINITENISSIFKETTTNFINLIKKNTMQIEKHNTQIKNKIFKYINSIKNFFNDIINTKYIKIRDYNRRYRNDNIIIQENNDYYVLDVSTNTNINIIDNLYKNYLKDRHTNSCDLADNIIDYQKKKYFIGGSRNIKIIFDNYNELLDTFKTFNSKEKKIIFILSCQYLDDLDEITTIINDDTIDYKQKFNNLNTLINHHNNTYINEYFNNFCIETYNNIIINDTNNHKLYSNYIKNCTKYSNSNLKATCHKIIIQFFSSFIHNDPINWELSFKQIIKYNNFYDCIIFYYSKEDKSYDNYLKGLALWACYLLHDIDIDIKTYDPLLNITDNNLKKIIENIFTNNDENNIDIIKSNKTVELINKYYDRLITKCQYVYLLDLVYYVLNPLYLYKYINFANFDTISDDPILFIYEILDDNILNINIDTYTRKNTRKKNDIYIYNCIYKQLPPSLSSFLYVIIDDFFILNDHYNNNYLYNKYIESYHIGILFYGCIYDIYDENFYDVIKNDDIFQFKLSNDNTFIFNPKYVHRGNFNDNNQNLQFDYFPDTPLLFNYFRNYENNDNYNKDIYFKYIYMQYRPASYNLFKYSIQLINDLFNNYLIILLNKYKEILNNLLYHETNISSIYNEYYVLIKLIYNKLKNINKFNIDSNINMSYFNYNLFITKINDINSYIFFWYYNKDNINIPQFIYHNLDSNKYELYNNSADNINMIGGSYKNIIDEFYVNYIDIKKNSYIINKNDILPPSINSNLELFYKLYKRKFITDTFKDNRSSITYTTHYNYFIKKNNDLNYYYLICAKLIEELIKDILIDKLKNRIKQKISDKTSKKKVLTTSVSSSYIFSPVVLNSTYNEIINIYKSDKIDILLYNISDKNITDIDNNIFIIYPNEYTNTNLLLQKYYVEYKYDIIYKLLEKDASLFILDNNNSTCIHNAVKIFNYNFIDKIKIGFCNYEYNFIKEELTNHKNKMICNTYKKTFDNFIKTQFEEIKLLILSNEAYGNNILYNLNNSFKICFYIMNEYITDYLWTFDNNYTYILFELIVNKLEILNVSDINNNYLNDMCIENRESLYNNTEKLIENEIKKIFCDKLNYLNEELSNLKIQKENKESLKLNIDNINVKIKNIEIEIDNIKTKIKEVESSPVENYEDPNIGIKKKIIETYDKLTFKGYGVYFEMWKLLLNSEDLLKNSFNLSLINILNLDFENNENLDIILSYLNHLEPFVSTYFINNKYINNKINKILTFIYDLLVHLTKTVICFGIEIITRKILYNYLIKNNDIEYIILSIDSLIKDSTNSPNEGSFMDVLYSEYPEKFVKNSINIFSSLEEKVNFEPISVNEMLQNLFRKLNNPIIIDLDESVMHNLNKNIANYFDLFTTRVIKNWFVVCENTLKFIINHQRICNTLKVLQE